LPWWPIAVQESAVRNLDYRRGYDDELPPANPSSMKAAKVRALALACRPVRNTAHNTASHRHFLAEATALFQRD